ncbi:MAG TPA: CBS domain-containing protein [Cryptosporangiaceae bacterium]|nr:CBS domain-containing protein [Cryptosporangiaceae bacterium]
MAQKVRELMSADPVTVASHVPLVEAAQKMRDEDIGDVLVLDGDRLCGVVTDRDLVVRGLAEGREPTTTPVGEICTHEVVTVSPDDDAGRAVELMREHAVRRLPVTQDGAPVGIISIGDLAMELDEQSALADISAAPPNN